MKKHINITYILLSICFVALFTAAINCFGEEPLHNGIGINAAETQQTAHTANRQNPSNVMPNKEPDILTITVTNKKKTVTFKMIRVAAGTFMMGDKKGKPDAQPVHSVTLTNDYYMGETEVTQELWTAVMGKNPSDFESPKNPVECVSWDDCQKFIRKLNKLTGKKFRLPTEAEWEYAARGGNKSKGCLFAGSNNIDDVAWYWDNSMQQTHPVAQKQPNELGLYDMCGNVWEWCNDKYDSTYYSHSPATNPTGPATGTGLVRGGAWNSSDEFYNPTYRLSFQRNQLDCNTGLRLAL